MARTHSTLRTLTTLALLAGLAIVCAMMGNWQLRRAAERDAIMQTIEAGRKASPVKLDAATPSVELVQWRRAVAQGVWLHDFTVLLDNRNFKGKPGFWVATPLLIDSEKHTALLVLRGWLPRPILPGETLPPLPRPEGAQTVQGQLVSHVPRMFELWSLSGNAGDTPALQVPGPDGTLPRLQNLALKDLSSATGLKLMPTVLEQTGDGGNVPAKTPLVQEWPQPSVDSDQNRGYALQWFGFACIAAIAWLVVAWRTLRRRTPPAR